MSGVNRGKQFEKIVHKQLEQLKNAAVLRLYDVTMGFKGINNPCDFILYKKPKMILLECKTSAGPFLNFNSDIRENQWKKMQEYSKIDGVEAGILVWFYNFDLTYYISIEDLQIYKDNGKRSFNCKVDIPTIILKGKKKRFFYEYFMNTFVEELLNE